MKRRFFYRLFAGVFVAVLSFGAAFRTVSTASAAWFPDDKLVTVSDSAYGKSELKFEPVGVIDVASKEILESVASEKNAAVAILNLDDDMNVKGAGGETICSLATAMDDYLKKEILPVFNIGSVAQAEKLIAWFRTDREILDASVMSGNAEAVKKFRAAYPHVRGIIEFDENAEIENIVKIANENGANICVIPEKLSTVKNVRYIQGRFKTVWTRAESGDETSTGEASAGETLTNEASTDKTSANETTADKASANKTSANETTTTEASIKNGLFSGAYGVIVRDAKKFSEIIAGLSGLTRTPFNVAHRGLPNEYNENSVSGTLAAIEAGATHVELDCYLTTDGEIVFMHDAGLARTSTGTGNIENYSSAELKKFRLKQYGDEAIPTFADIAGALKNTDVVLILEIKSQKTEIVNALKAKLEGSGIENQIVVISFHESQIKAMKETLPQIPVADLNGSTSDSLKAILKKSGENNSGIDYNFNALDDEKINGLIVRGFIPWTWTYTRETDVTFAYEQGFTGITNNCADSLKNIPLYVEGQATTDKVPEKGGDIKLTVTEYGGGTKEVTGKITDVKKINDDEYEVFAEYYPQEYYLETKLYTQKFTVSTKTSDGDSGSGADGGRTGGCGAGLLFGAGFDGPAVCLAAIGLFAAAVIAFKHIKGKENG